MSDDLGWVEGRGTMYVPGVEAAQAGCPWPRRWPKSNRGRPVRGCGLLECGWVGWVGGWVGGWISGVYGVGG